MMNNEKLDKALSDHMDWNKNNAGATYKAASEAYDQTYNSTEGDHNESMRAALEVAIPNLMKRHQAMVALVEEGLLDPESKTEVLKRVGKKVVTRRKGERTRLQTHQLITRFGFLAGLGLGAGVGAFFVDFKSDDLVIRWTIIAIIIAIFFGLAVRLVSASMLRTPEEKEHAKAQRREVKALKKAQKEEHIVNDFDDLKVNTSTHATA